MNRLAILLLTAALFPTLYAEIPVYASESDVVINEIEANPPGTDGGAESVELYNLGGVPVDIGGWTISSTAVSAVSVTIAAGTVIPARDYVVVGKDSGWIDNVDESLILRNNSGDTIDSSTVFSDEDNDANTWQRSPDGADNWVFEASTLGGANVGTMVEPEPIPEPGPTPEPQPPNPLMPSQNNTLPLPTPVLTPAPSNEELKIIFIDVGQGSSELIILPNNMTVLIDGGDRDEAGSVLSTLQEYGVSRIDVMVATHPHSDHIGGLIDVINAIEVGKVFDSGQIYTTPTFEDFLDAIDAKQIPFTSVHQGDSIDLVPTVSLDVLNPPVTLMDGADDESLFNDNSVVIKLTYGEFSALLTGDMEATNEAGLVGTNATDLDADVMLAGYHGSSTSSSTDFLAAVTPQVVVISVGANNSYGYPHQETLERISAAGVQHLLRTDIDGNILITSSGWDDYSFQTSRSNKSVVVPEFEAAIAILVVSFLLIMSNRVRIWKISRQA
jgi:competence protein ComEC